MSRDAMTGGGIRDGSVTDGACEFWSSFVTWDLPPQTAPDARPFARHNIPFGNKVRMPLDALLTVTDGDGGGSELFGLTTPHRTEWVFAERGLFAFYPPEETNHEYREVFSRTEERNLGAYPLYRTEPERRRARPHHDRYRSVAIDVKRAAQTRVLEGAGAIIAAVEEQLPLVGRTEIRDSERKQGYVLEYPIRVMNYRPEDHSFQANAGPVLLPDFSCPEERVIDRLELAYVVYNHLGRDRAEFIFRRPMPIKDERGGRVCWVLHYTEVRTYAVHTVLLAGELN